MILLTQAHTKLFIERDICKWKINRNYKLCAVFVVEIGVRSIEQTRAYILYAIQFKFEFDFQNCNIDYIHTFGKNQCQH